MKKILKIAKIFIILITGILLILGLVPFIISHEDKIYVNTAEAPNYDVICLLGARVYKKGILSPIVRQRCDTLLKFKSNRSIKTKIVVTGSGSYEVDYICKYIINRGINNRNIVRDNYGYDTHDSMRKLRQLGFKNPLLISQSFHLFRAIEMGIDEELQPVGIAAEKITPVNETIPIWKKYSIRINRHYRNSILFIAYKVGLYDYYSTEAENLLKLKLSLI